jgi:hypothetical protein
MILNKRYLNPVVLVDVSYGRIIYASRKVPVQGQVMIEKRERSASQQQFLSGKKQYFHF